MTQDNGMDCTPNWQELKDERDALAAHVERLHGVLREIQRIELDGHHFIRKEWVKTLLLETPATPLARLKAEWQAEALYEFTHGSYVMPATLNLAMCKRADELRRQAEEVS